MNHPDRDLTQARWRTSSYSGSGNQCVEVAALNAEHRAVRDSKDPHGPALMFTPTEWRSLLVTLKRI
ncbi:DUF397 domain-containing protein [Actinomadura sp. 9N407]|uniref:DUF397 domain-containing protein n=1 Tax=Actinomadura sp. 9N407 TaxID=3375154 RepID=UPI0037B5179F